MKLNRRGFLTVAGVGAGAVAALPAMAAAADPLEIADDGLEVIAAYSRDHDRFNGAATFTVQKAGIKVLVQRLPDMAAPLQKRFLINAIHWLTET